MTPWEMRQEERLRDAPSSAPAAQHDVLRWSERKMETRTRRAAMEQLMGRELGE